ncbi:MAG: hypothetical protein R3A52_23115 [Polyangiales bacterium]
MSDIWTVLLLATLPGAGNFAGGMLAEFTRPSARALNRALHAAAGIVIAIVSVELMPRTVGHLGGGWIAAAFMAGGVAYLLLESLTERLQGGDEGAGRARMWMIYIAVAADLTSDGLMIGAGAAVSSKLAFVLAAGQVLADLPEGYAAVANLRDKGVPRTKRVLLAASFLGYVVVSALLAHFALRGAPERVKLGSLVFVAGLLTVAAVEDMLQEAHDAREDSRWSVLAFVGGFALFTLVSSGLEAMLRGSLPAT